MNTHIYLPGEIPEDIVVHGRSYIITRFRQVWGVDRSSEITNDSIAQRTNIVAFRGNRLIGWLGLNPDWELVNGCAGPERSGPIFTALLNRLFKDFPRNPFYAYVPIEYLACAYLCINAGMRVPSTEDGLIIRRVYKGRVVTLVKLIFPLAEESQAPISHKDRKERIDQLHEIIDQVLDDSPLAKISSLLQRTWKSISSDHSARHAADVFGCLSLFLGASFVYYNLVLATIGGHNIPRYYDFIGKKKPELDRHELQQYLKITTAALGRFTNHAKQNKLVIADMAGRSQSLQNAAGAGGRLRVLNDKQVASLDLMHNIVLTYSNEIGAGNEIGRKAPQLYAAVLQYLSEDKPYSKLIDMLKTTHLHMNKKDLESLQESCNNDNDCDLKAATVLKNFVQSNSRTDWLSVLDW